MNIYRLIESFRHAGRIPEVARCLRGATGPLGVIAGYLGLRALSYPREFRLRGGQALTLDSWEDLTTAWVVFFGEEYRVPHDCRTIVDAGANIGAFSLLAARDAPGARIVALEPFPSTRARLEETVRRNALEGRVACRPWALGRADAPRHMDDADGIAGHSRSLATEGSPTQGVLVEAITLATLWEREGLDRVDLLKIDIEGSEYELIAETPSEILRRSDRIVIEYHPGGSKAALFSSLRSAGFELVRDLTRHATMGTAHFQLARRPGRVAAT